MRCAFIQSAPSSNNAATAPPMSSATLTLPSAVNWQCVNLDPQKLDLSWMDIFKRPGIPILLIAQGVDKLDIYELLMRFGM